MSNKTPASGQTPGAIPQTFPLITYRDDLRFLVVGWVPSPDEGPGVFDPLVIVLDDADPNGAHPAHTLHGGGVQYEIPTAPTQTPAPLRAA